MSKISNRQISGFLGSSLIKAITEGEQTYMKGQTDFAQLFAVLARKCPGKNKLSVVYFPLTISRIFSVFQKNAKVTKTIQWQQITARKLGVLWGKFRSMKPKRALFF